jgi:hypothetical protein
MAALLVVDAARRGVETDDERIVARTDTGAVRC